ncbi:hypothetical protein PLICRDRAFT_95936 [Plicaturopsis crispa FD-325 SS-3]|uniref:Uncharacterized protein n=1 Tax=Plicaturopsis crispa FD-325 SS-3 TaxID=944288 RepID=A0A0C9T5K3_PLICR|nr:hypothetical protein PLICRDRAFT_95936 [Plicaturopsis crispa FD-325 SS-3]
MSTASNLTSSDKLSALPPPSLPPHGRTRAPNRGGLSVDASTSLPSFESFSAPNLLMSTAPEQPKDSPKQRVSFDSDRGSLPTMHSVRQAFSRANRGSDPPAPGSFHETPPPNVRKHSLDGGGASRSQSRTNSPLRLFQWSGLHRPQSREEPFVPVDPFKLRLRYAEYKEHHRRHSLERLNSGEPQSASCALPLPASCLPAPSPVFAANARTFLTDTLPRQVYLHLLLRLPSLYFSRVARIFEDAEVSRPDIQRMIDACAPASERHSEPGIDAALASSIRGATVPVLPFPEEWTPPTVSPALVRFKISWEEFITSLLREWKTLNVVSALLLSAILTMFQVPSAADDPVVRTPALLSLICALMSLSYGCMYIVRFGTMRSMYKASKWAEEARKTNTVIWWNVWVLLAMPGIWLAWSMILFIVSILSFVWRTGSTADPADPSALPPHAALGPRIAVTAVFALGTVYFALIVRTLKRYGSAMNTRERRAVRALWSPTRDDGERRGRAMERDGGSRSGHDVDVERGRRKERQGDSRKERATELSRPGEGRCPDDGQCRGEGREER